MSIRKCMACGYEKDYMKDNKPEFRVLEFSLDYKVVDITSEDESNHYQEKQFTMYVCPECGTVRAEK